MKSDARLESLVFQLTPTRTRCDLVATSNGRTEKIASGLLNPFLAHLKTAQDQIAKGGYSITLQPPHGVDAPWFTKDTIEKFVRFVNTPEVLERVNAIEIEILQIEEALAIQGNECLALGNVENHATRPLECIEGNKSTCENDAEKAIVLYKPGAKEPDSNGSTVKAENSKVQLMRVLQTRKSVLQKEQGMAFARAAAAGFEMDKMTYLVSFAECFGASRFLVACMKFMELWKGKHETGQWIEIEAAEAMSVQSDFPSVNASGIFLSDDTRRHSDTSNGKHNSDTSAEYLYSNPNRGRTSGDPQLSLGCHEYLHGQLQHPIFPQWPVHCPPGAPGFQSYPMQGVPYYQNYPGTGPLFQHPSSAMEDPGNTFQGNVKIKKHSVEDGKDIIDESEMVDDMDQDTLEFDKDASQGCGSHRNCGRSGKNKPGMVVIRNINYITSKRHNASESETGSASSSDTEEGHENLRNEAPERNKKSLNSSKNKGKSKSLERTNLCEEDANCGQEAGSENWQVFQSFLLRDEDSSRRIPADDTMFSGEKFRPMSRRHSNAIPDPMLPPDRSSGDILERRAIEFDTGNGRVISRKKAAESEDNLACSNVRRISGDCKLDVKFQELETGGGKYKRGPSDDFMIYERGKPIISRSSLDPLSENIDKPGGNFGEAVLPDIIDESFMVPSRFFSQKQVGPDGRAAIDVDLDIPAGFHSLEGSSLKNRNQVCNEPDDLSLMLNRRAEVGYPGNDHAIDDVMKAHDNNNVNGTQENIPPGAKESLKKLDKEKKARTSRDRSEKRMTDSLRRGKPSRLNPLAEAQARAEKLRAYKADLQKSKKEKEEQEMRRLEALKRERQKRIAARGTSSSVQTVTTTRQNQTRVPAKLSPRSHASSKFSDSDPSSSSILHKLPARTSIGSSDSQKTTKNSKPYGRHSAGSSLSRSASLLRETTKADGVLVPEQKKDVKLKRLSYPIGAAGHSSAKSVSRSQVSKQNISGRKGTTVPCASPVTSGCNNSELKHIFDEPKIKNISANVKVDRSNSAAGQQLNTRMQTGIRSAVGKKCNVKDAASKGNVKNSSLISEDKEKKNVTEKTQQPSDEDDKLIVEKSIVIQDKEVVPVPLVASSDGDKGEFPEIVPESIGIQNPPPTMIPSEIVNAAKELDEKPTYEVTVDCVKDQTENFSSFMTEKPYEAPVAQASAMEDSGTNTFNHSEAVPTRSSVVAKSSSQNIQTETSTFSNTNKVEHEYDKPLVHESSKGFKRLWKFGRRGHSSASDERNMVSECSSVDGNATNAVSSKEAPTLKTLISEDDPHAKSNSKASRSFSILSSFRSKNSEKKIMV